MTTDEMLEKVLIEKNIFPPSVQDSQYSINAEMTKDEVIEKTLREMDRHRPWGQGTDDADYLPTIIAELQRRLPDGNIKTCGAFKHFDAACCDSCHTFYAQYEMNLLDLADGTKAWVCDNIMWAIYPERYAEYQEWLRNSPLGELVSKTTGDAAIPKN